MARQKDTVNLEWLEDAAGEALEKGDPEQMAWALNLVRLGSFEVVCHPGGTRKRWQSEQVLEELRNLASVNEDGERLSFEDELANFERAIRDCVPLTQSLGWRARGLKAWGIDPGEYSEYEPGRPRVEVREVGTDV